jgi:hypothetical protein
MGSQTGKRFHCRAGMPPHLGKILTVHIVKTSGHALLGRGATSQRIFLDIYRLTSI